MASLAVSFLLGLHLILFVTEVTFAVPCFVVMPNLRRSCRCTVYVEKVGTAMKRLWSVSCVGLGLQNISATLSPDVAYLDYTFNNISNIPVTVMENYTQLQQLLLRRNGVRKIEPGTFKKQIRLRELMLNHNKLTSIEAGTFKGLRSLETLDLKFNSIENIKDGAFTDCSALQELDLSDNAISDLPTGVFGDLKALKTLILRSNTIKSLTAGLLNGLGVLKSLDMNANIIDTVEPVAYQESPVLKELYLNDNRLDFSIDAESLEALYNFKYLKALGLGGNEVPFIKSSAVFESLKYEDLNISHSSVSVIHNGSLNRLRYLKTLHLYNNPLICDCKMSWINSWLDKVKNSLTLVKPLITSCLLPQTLNGSTIASLEKEDFVCSCESCTNDFSMCLASPGSNAAKCSCNNSWTGLSCNQVCTAFVASYELCSATDQGCFCSQPNSFLQTCPQNSHWKMNNCICDRGFSGKACEEVNECELKYGRKGCDENARCIDTVGSYRCICKSGYNGNGTSCKAIRKGLTRGQIITIGASSACVLVIIILVLVFCCWRMRRKRRKKKEAPETQLQLKTCSAMDDTDNANYEGQLKP